jgi:hypothetical protein
MVIICSLDPNFITDQDKYNNDAFFVAFILRHLQPLMLLLSAMIYVVVYLHHINSYKVISKIHRNCVQQCD